jgi:hypothetical protein
VITAQPRDIKERCIANCTQADLAKGAGVRKARG